MSNTRDGHQEYTPAENQCSSEKRQKKVVISIWVLHEIDGNQLMYTPFLHSVTRKC